MTHSQAESRIATLRLTSTSRAAELIVAGKLVAFPTETVYGLGVDARSSEAVQRLFRAKGRPGDNPLIVHLDSLDRWRAAARELTESAIKFLEAFSPGPLTVVLPKHPSIASEVTAGLDSVGIRIPSHPEARELLAHAGIPVAAPSANRSGRPSCTTWQAIIEDMDGHIDAVLLGKACDIGVESTVVDCCGEQPIVLRPGGVTLQQLRTVVPQTLSLDEHLQRRQLGQASQLPDAGAEHPLPSPGLRHPHYKPRARILLVEEADIEKVVQPENRDDLRDYNPPGKRVAFVGLRSHHWRASEQECLQRFYHFQLFEGVDQYAAGFYEFLRECDRKLVDLIFVQRSPLDGVGEALSERQHRASS